MRRRSSELTTYISGFGKSARASSLGPFGDEMLIVYSDEHIFAKFDQNGDSQLEMNEIDVAVRKPPLPCQHRGRPKVTTRWPPQSDLAMARSLEIAKSYNPIQAAPPFPSRATGTLPPVDALPSGCITAATFVTPPHSNPMALIFPVSPSRLGVCARPLGMRLLARMKRAQHTVHIRTGPAPRPRPAPGSIKTARGGLTPRFAQCSAQAKAKSRSWSFLHDYAVRLQRPAVGSGSSNE